MNYVISSAVITAPGKYEYRHVSISEAANWLKSRKWHSTVGYEETARVMSKFFDVHVPFNRRVISMKPGDEALVFRVVFPKGYRPDPKKKGQLSDEFVAKNCEIGILKRIE